MKRRRARQGERAGVMRRSGGNRSFGRRRRIMQSALLLAGILVGFQAYRVQVLEADEWASRAAGQHGHRLPLAAPRGAIYDRNGVPLAAVREGFSIAVAPPELVDRDAAAERLREVLDLSAADARSVVSSERRWVVLPGVHGPGARERLDGLRGIYFERVMKRSYPGGGVAREVLGTVSGDGRALSGLELELDSLLAGRAGAAVVRRDAAGKPIPGAMMTVLEPVPGHDIHLAIDADLQEMAEQALRDAIRETEATGGDLLLADPRTGDLLAAVSRRGPGAARWTAVTDPYEPGSTMKPFVVAALLAEGRATLGDSLDAGGGQYMMGRRTITDDHGYVSLTLGEALQYSSNVAVVRAAERLEAGEQYRYLRDFGFGTPTGVRHPSESGGVLRRPSEWSAYSQASLAMGYEVAVTPLQMTMAYGALANRGVLMEPRLVREVRAADGRSRQRFPARNVRRVVPERVAEQLVGVLVDAVETGTGQEAALGAFRVGGKTGTAWRFEDGRYGRGEYNASFAGFFPATDPQLVFLVKLDGPKGAYFGGRTAAPVMRTLLTAALAAPGTPIDRTAVMASTRAPRPGAELVPAAASPVSSEATAASGASGMESDRPQRSRTAGFGFVEAALTRADLDLPTQAPVALASDDGLVVVDVHGLSLREAAKRLHGRGFHVEVEGSGMVRSMSPAAGTHAAPGSVVQIRGEQRAEPLD